MRGRLIWCFLLFSLSLFMGCKEKEPKKEEAKAEKPREEKAEASDPLDALLAASAPVLPEGLEGLQWGATKEEVQAAIPALTPRGPSLILNEEVFVGFLDGASQVTLFFKTSPKEKLEKAWGPPSEEHSGFAWIWVNPEMDLRARLDKEEGAWLELEPYRALSELFPKQPGFPTFLAETQWEMSEAALRAAVPELGDKDFFSLRMHPGLKVGLSHFMGVRRFTFFFPEGEDKVLREKWGEGQLTTPKPGETRHIWLVPGQQLRIEQHQLPNVNSPAKFSEYLPSDHFLSNRAKFDFLSELGAPILGMDEEVLSRVFGDRYRPPPKEGFWAEVVLPPMDYSDHLTTLTLTLREGKVAELSFSVSFEALKEGPDALRTRLVERWGEPKAEEDRKGPYERFDSPTPVRLRKRTKDWRVTLGEDG